MRVTNWSFDRAPPLGEALIMEKRLSPTLITRFKHLITGSLQERALARLRNTVMKGFCVTVTGIHDAYLAMPRPKGPV